MELTLKVPALNRVMVDSPFVNDVLKLNTA